MFPFPSKQNDQALASLKKFRHLGPTTLHTPHLIKVKVVTVTIYLSQVEGTTCRNSTWSEGFFESNTMNANSHNRASVLIVDDAASARTVLKDMLVELGFGAILEASDGREATEILERQSVDIVLCDQVMPDMSGKDLLVHIREGLQKEKLPVIFVSALGAVSDVEEVLDLSATDYLVKPVSLRKLRRKIEDALQPVTERIELLEDKASSLNQL
jgi:CheY-like chemotaxis protein